MGLTRSIARWGLNIIVAIAIAVGLVVFAFQPVQVQGYSMMPRLNNQERLFVDKIGVNFARLRRGDVVVFHYPRDPSENFIKRVIGLPGDHVAIWGGTVFINGQRLVEPYVPSRFRDNNDYPAVTVPWGDYYVLGDHRNSSNDSRFWGCLPAANIFGRAVFAYWPVDDFGPVH